MSQNYQIKGLLAKTETAGIYHAVDPQRGNDVALRRFYPNSSQVTFSNVENVYLDMCQRIEAIRHPNLLYIYDYGVDEDGPFMATQLVPAQSLQQHMQSGPYTEKQALAFARHILDALRATHEQKFIHGALHPTSILIIPREGKENLAMVQDLGIHYIDKIINGANRTFFEPAISPPERFETELPSIQGDLYTLGNLIYMSLLGGHPFANLSENAAFIEHSKNGLPSLRQYREDISEEFRQWLRWMLHVDPGQRPRTAQLAYDHLPLKEKQSPVTSVLAPTAVSANELASMQFLQKQQGVNKPPITTVIGSKTLQETQPLTIKPVDAPQVKPVQTNAALQGKMLASAQENEFNNKAILVMVILLVLVLLGVVIYAI